MKKSELSSVIFYDSVERLAWFVKTSERACDKRFKSMKKRNFQMYYDGSWRLVPCSSLLSIYSF